MTFVSSQQIVRPYALWEAIGRSIIDVWQSYHIHIFRILCHNSLYSFLLQILPDHGLTDVHYRCHLMLDDIPITLLVITDQ